MTAYVDPFADRGMFEDLELPPPVSLSDKFGVPPMSILDRRGGDWQDRKRKWLSLGIESEVGRDTGLVYAKAGGGDPVSQMLRKISDGTSVFDPVICELVYRWFSRPGALVLDPFSGGSVRGIVASTLAQYYLGVDIRAEQVGANRAQVHIGSDIAPHWIVGDATDLDASLGTDDEFDLIFSCPPYGDLEQYSDDPRDISTWTWPEFIQGHAQAIRGAVTRLRRDRFAAWVVGDVRDKKAGTYRGLHHETVRAFADAGCQPVNEFVIVDPVGTAAVRAERPFRANRKAALTHQHLLVFVKGDLNRAARWAEAS